jgi:hypothetical protein
MNSILRILANIALLPVTGCIFPANRDYSDDRTRVRVPLNQPSSCIGTKAADSGNLASVCASASVVRGG